MAISLYRDGVEVYRFEQEGIVFNEFNTNTSYQTNEYVIYNNAIYKANTTTTTGSFIESEWDSIGGGNISIDDTTTDISWSDVDYKLSQWREESFVFLKMALCMDEKNGKRN